MRRTSMLLLTLALSHSAFSQTVLPFTEGARVTALIAVNDITRLIVEGDRIQKCIGIKGAYQLEHAEGSGEVYVQPASTSTHRAFSLFIATERGRHVTLLLYPLAVPGDTLFLVPSNKEGRGGRYVR